MGFGAAAAQIAHLEAKVAALQVELEMERRVSAQQREVIGRLEARLAELEMRVRQDSGSSHKPPSSDRPWSERFGQTLPKKKSGKKRGGQKGHKGTRRQMVPLGEVEHVQRHEPRRCSGCGESLRASDRIEVQRWQVTELVPMASEVTEHRAHRMRCGRCGIETKSPLPSEVTRSAFGPRLQSVVAMLSGGCRMSKRTVQKLLQQLWGVDISLGSICVSEQHVAQALKAPYEQVHRFVQRQSRIYADETGFLQEQKRAWLWTAATDKATVFRIEERRTKAVAQALLGDFAGLLTTDRCGSYRFHPMRKRQVCWAHLHREFRALRLLETKGARIGRWLDAWTSAMFALWKRIRDGTVAGCDARTAMRPIRIRIERWLARGAQSDCRIARRLCKGILRYKPALWTFLRVQGAQPTNNAAERALRHAVIWRKTSFGTQSPRGSRFVERILTAIASLGAQGRDLLDYLLHALRAHASGQTVPTLCP